jgi:hypothetical protein
MSLHLHAQAAALGWTIVVEPLDDVEPDGDEPDGDEPLRWYVVAAYMALVIVGFALAVWFTVSWYGDCHANSSTGRATTYAGDSARGALCSSAHGVAGLLVPIGWLVGLGLATLALARWGGSRVRALLLALLFVAPALLPTAAYGGLGSSGKECTGQKLEDYRAWVDDGSKGTAPYDCRTF